MGDWPVFPTSKVVAPLAKGERLVVSPSPSISPLSYTIHEGVECCVVVRGRGEGGETDNCGSERVRGVAVSERGGE